MGRMTEGAMQQFAKTTNDLRRGDLREIGGDFARASRGQFAGVDALVPLALSIVLLAIVVGLGALILSEMDNTTTDTDASAVLSEGITAMTDFADFFTIIVVVGVAAVIFLLLRVVRRSGMAASA